MLINFFFEYFIDEKELWRYSRSGRMTVAEAWQLFVPFFIEGTIWTVVGYGTLRFLYGGFGNLIPKPLPTAEVEHGLIIDLS